MIDVVVAIQYCKYFSHIAFHGSRADVREIPLAPMRKMNSYFSEKAMECSTFFSAGSPVAEKSSLSIIIRPFIYFVFGMCC